MGATVSKEVETTKDSQYYERFTTYSDDNDNTLTVRDVGRVIRGQEKSDGAYPYIECANGKSDISDIGLKMLRNGLEQDLSGRNSVTYRGESPLEKACNAVRR
jgi:hypothetical protein